MHACMHTPPFLASHQTPPPPNEKRKKKKHKVISMSLILSRIDRDYVYIVWTLSKKT